MKGMSTEHSYSPYSASPTSWWCTQDRPGRVLDPRFETRLDWRAEISLIFLLDPSGMCGKARSVATGSFRAESSGASCITTSWGWLFWTHPHAWNWEWLSARGREVIQQLTLLPGTQQYRDGLARGYLSHISCATLLLSTNKRTAICVGIGTVLYIFLKCDGIF
jgi:hypothetical protein